MKSYPYVTREVDSNPGADAKRWLVDLILNSWEEMGMQRPPDGPTFERIVEHYGLRFRAFDVTEEGEHAPYLVEIAYLDKKSFAIWGPWNGAEEPWYWETCYHCVPLLGVFNRLNSKRREP